MRTRSRRLMMSSFLAGFALGIILATMAWILIGGKYD